MTTTTATLPLLHRLLGIGLLFLASISLGLRYLRIVPLLPTDDFTRMMSYVLAGAGVVLIAVALVVLKPRAPNRRPEQPVEQYWSTPEVGKKVTPVWFLLEGAGVLSVVGYLMTGESASAIAAGVAIAAFWLVGPNTFAKS